MTMLWLFGATAVAVFAVMIYSIATFTRPARAGAAALRRGALVETLWALVPIAIMVSMAAPAVRQLLAAEAPASPVPTLAQHPRHFP